LQNLGGTMRARIITLSIAVLSTIATFLSTLTDAASVFHTSPEQAVFISALGAGIYALVRAIQKVKAGTSVRALLATSEAKGVALVYLGAIAYAVKGVVSPAHAGIAVAIATVLMIVARNFRMKGGDGSGSGISGGPVGMPPAATVGLLLLLGVTFTAPCAMAEPTPPTVAPSVASPAAPTKSIQLGFCNKAKTFCTQPAVAVSAFQLNLKTLDYERVAFGIGYGGVYKGLPVNLGAAVYLGAGVSQKTPNALQGNLLFSVADVVAFGPGIQVFKDPTTGSAVWQALLSLCGNLTIGGTTTFIENLINAYEHPVVAPPAAPTPPVVAPTPVAPSVSPPAAPAPPVVAPSVSPPAAPTPPVVAPSVSPPAVPTPPVVTPTPVPAPASAAPSPTPVTAPVPDASKAVL
jgi:hypothetical protein